jgi:GntR family transcriptional regulator
MTKEKRTPPIQIDLQAEAPAYLQIMVQIEGMILREKIIPGDQLPTVRQLASELSINFNTVARAYRLLDRAGFITTQQGRGTFALDSSRAQDRLRYEVLQELTAQFLAEISKMEFSPEEVQKAFQEQLDALISQADRNFHS